MSFSATVRLKDLNDFISPSQSCVVFEQPNQAVKQTPLLKSHSLGYEDNSGGPYIPKFQVMKADQKEKAAAKVSLSDCLACSGCITSAETVLLEMHSLDLFKERLSDHKNPIILILSTQSLMSLLASFNIESHIRLEEFFELLRSFMEDKFKDKFDLITTTNEAERICLEKTKAEFLAKFNFDNKGKLRPEWIRPPESKAISKSKIQLNDRDNTVVDALEFDRMNPPMQNPYLISSCPGWTCFVEKQYPEVIPMLSRVISPQAISANMYNCNLGNRRFVVTVMPCPDKKLEALRRDFYCEETNKHDVDLVLTTTEFNKFLQENNFQTHLSRDHLHSDRLEKLSHLAKYNMGSGGFVEYIFRAIAKEKFGLAIDNTDKLPYKREKNKDFVSVSLQKDGQVLLSCALVYGFRNIQALIRQLKAGSCKYDIVEVMACPQGCLNGGGQIPITENNNPNFDIYLAYELSLRLTTESTKNSKDLDNYKTRFHNVPKIDSPLLQQW